MNAIIYEVAVVADYVPVYIYFGVVFFVTLAILGVSAFGLPNLIKTNTSPPDKYRPYESGILTQTNLLRERFPLRHYLVALIFLIFDVEVIFLFPWAVIAQSIGAFAFYEMAFFLIALLVGFAYVWKKGGLEWE